MEAAVQPKRSIAGTSILSILISVFNHGQQLSPVILFVVDKGLEISFYSAVLPFCLPIRLRVEGGRESLLVA